MSRVLVLGGNGFVGRHVVRAMIDAGHAVRVYERRLPVGLPQEVEIREGRLEDRESLARAVEGRDAVVYLSWTGYPATFNADFAMDIHANLFTAISVMETCKEAGCGRLVFASSGGTVYGPPLFLPIPETHPTRPIGAHGLGKLIAEQYLAVYRHREELPSIVLRAANAYGPGQGPGRGQGLLATALGRLAEGRPLELWGDGAAVRDYVFVTDLAAAFLRALEYEGKETVFNIGTGRGLSVRDALKAIEQVTGSSPQVSWGPSRDNDVSANVLDVRLARSELHWEAQVPFAVGLTETWDWIRSSWLPTAR